MKKKDKKDKKRGKGEPAAAAVSLATAEALDDEDRSLSGLTPAAKLARQHTLRAKAEAEKKDAEKRLSVTSASAAQSPSTGEPTWDVNTVTRLHSPAANGAPLPPGASRAPEILHVQPRQTGTVVHAVAVTDAEYDSADDVSSDGETVEDVADQFRRSRISDSPTVNTIASAELDREFVQMWPRGHIDRNAVPRKGILKSRSIQARPVERLANL